MPIKYFSTIKIEKTIIVYLSPDRSRRYNSAIIRIFWRFKWDWVLGNDLNWINETKAIPLQSKWKLNKWILDNLNYFISYKITSEHSSSLLLQKILTQGFFFSCDNCLLKYRLLVLHRSSKFWYCFKIHMYHIVVIFQVHRQRAQSKWDVLT